MITPSPYRYSRSSHISDAQCTRYSSTRTGTHAIRGGHSSGSGNQFEEFRICRDPHFAEIRTRPRSLRATKACRARAAACRRQVGSSASCTAASACSGDSGAPVARSRNGCALRRCRAAGRAHACCRSCRPSSGGRHSSPLHSAPQCLSLRWSPLAPVACPCADSPYPLLNGPERTAVTHA